MSARVYDAHSIVNIDSTALPLVKPGNLVEVAAAHLRLYNPNALQSLTDRQRIQLGRFLRGVKVIVNRNDPVTPRLRFKIKEVSREGAANLKFKDESGKESTVAQYFQKVHNVKLKGPSFPCVKLTAKAWFPMVRISCRYQH